MSILQRLPSLIRLGLHLRPLLESLLLLLTNLLGESLLGIELACDTTL